MKSAKLIVAYPRPKDMQAFEAGFDRQRAPAELRNKLD